MNSSKQKSPLNENIKIMPSLLDREIRSINQDAFGHRHFAEALESLIESPQNQPPFSIGLLGKWGTGKSSIKRLYLSELEDSRVKDKKSKIRSVKIHTITFNAWRYGGENIKRALLRHVFLELGGDESTLKDALFRQIQRPTSEAKSWKAIGEEIYDKWIWSLAQILLFFGVILLSLFLINQIFDLKDPLAITVIIPAVIAGAVIALKYYLDAKHFLVPRYAKINRIELPSVSAEEYEDLLV